MSEKKTQQELRAELNGKGMEKFTSSAHFGFIRWAPRCPPEPSPPKEPEDILHKTADYDVLRKGMA